MNHNVYDIRVKFKNGTEMFFDLLVLASQGQSETHSFALDWLNSIGVDIDGIESNENHFCHRNYLS